MPLKLKLIDSKTMHFSQIKPGDVWFCPWLIQNNPEGPDPEGLFSEETKQMYLKGNRILSSTYLKDWWGKRPPITMMLPDGTSFSPDAPALNDKDGWTVTGEVPDITIRASIMSPGYHGWCTNGMLSDDLEKRKYPSEIDQTGS